MIAASTAHTASGPVSLDLSATGVATVTFNRPHVRNAYDAATVRELARIFEDLGRREDVRIVLVRGAGPHFCAGADFSWMRKAGELSQEDNQADADAIACMFLGLYELPMPTVALVQGACLGGGMGFAAACDLCFATREATFGLTEVKFGLVPSIVGPYVVKAIGERAAARLFLTGAPIDAEEARHLGLVHDLANDAGGLAAIGHGAAEAILRAGPNAVRITKRFARAASSQRIDATFAREAAQHAARLRAEEEAREGMAAFLEKRLPAWSNTPAL